MKLRVARKFDKVMLDRENPSDFIKFIYEDLERQLYGSLMDKLKDHKPHAVRLSEPKIIEDVHESYWPESEARQDLVCIDLVQCKNCRMNFPWCQRFRDELGGEGFCPYGREIVDVVKEIENA
jgi:hypothetical protein